MPYIQQPKYSYWKYTYVNSIYNYNILCLYMYIFLGGHSAIIMHSFYLLYESYSILDSVVFVQVIIKTLTFG